MRPAQAAGDPEHLSEGGERAPAGAAPGSPPAPGSQEPSPHRGGWVRSASWPMQYFCRVEGPSLLGLDSPFLDVHLSDKTSQRDPGGQCGRAAPRAP